MADVYLIGAGPGDPGLLTVRAKELIETCDVLVYDYLANAEFLDYAKPGAEIVYVGKKGGDHTLPQDKINDLLVGKGQRGQDHRAPQGRRSLRLRARRRGGRGACGRRADL